MTTKGEGNNSGKIFLEKELEFFNSNREGWLKEHEGKYVLVKGMETVGFFDTVEKAYAEGIKRFGNFPFLIKQILREEPKEEIPALTLGLVNAHL